MIVILYCLFTYMFAVGAYCFVGSSHDDVVQYPLFLVLVAPSSVPLCIGWVFYKYAHNNGLLGITSVKGED